MRRMEAGHQQGVLGCDSGRNGLTDHAVDVTIVGDVLRVTVVGAKRNPRRAVLLDERQQVAQVPGHRGLPDQEPHARPDPLAALLHRQRLVIGVDAGRRICLEALAGQTGCVAVDVARTFEPELLELGRQAVDDAGEVHHLGQPEHPASAHQRLEIAACERPPRRLERRCRDAGGRHEQDFELETRCGVEQPVDAVDAEHVPHLVRVDDHRRRTERQHESRELVDEKLDRLEVHVGVDEPRDDIASLRVDRVVTLVGAETGDDAVDDRDVDVEPLPREAGEHEPPADDDVGGLVPPGDGEAAFECLHAAHPRGIGTGETACPLHRRPIWGGLGSLQCSSGT